jgi:hypothetical protein
MSVLLGEVAPQNTGVVTPLFSPIDKLVATPPPSEGIDTEKSKAELKFQVDTPSNGNLVNRDAPPSNDDYIQALKKYIPYVIVGAALLYYVMRKK